MMMVWSHSIFAEPGLEYSIARGGRLYDKWFKENNTAMPAQANPSYPENGKYMGKKGADWRCKECHGWDYQGNKGVYADGKHYTGIRGVYEARQMGKEDLGKILKNENHPFSSSMLSDRDINDLVNFLQNGQIEMAGYIDSKTKKIKGDSVQGQKYFETICASCHDLDGKGEKTPPLGQLVNDNPWEVMHKIQNGQPEEEMPPLRALDISVTLDIMAYMQAQLPQE
jgi:thiosulfate dehydrogenase